MKNIALHEEIRVVLSDRHNGVSCGSFESLNIASHVGDNSSHVEKNRAIFASYFDTKNLVFMDQVHGDNVQTIQSVEQSNICADAIMTNKKNLVLCVVVADCTPIVLYDKINRAIAVIHAGRAGCFLDIATKTINSMNTNFQTKNSDIMVYIGPFIKNCCYEIAKEVLEKAKNDFSYALEFRGKKYFLDIGKIIKKQLAKNGILKENIIDENICTCCNENFFSYRRDGECGRFGVGVELL